MEKENTKKQEVPLTPLYSDGTKEQGSKNNSGSVEGQKGGKSIPDPLGYC